MPKGGVFDTASPPAPLEIVCKEAGARQDGAKDADINTIVKRFERTGQLPVTNLVGVFEDVSQIGDYRGALDKIMVAEAAFMELPPEVRKRFDNDALQFVAFAVDPNNKAEMVELGLLEEVKPPAPAPAGAAPPAGA